MAFLGGFDASTVEPRKAIEALPEGKYIVIAENSVEKPNSKGTGTFLEFQFQVIDGHYQGQKLWDRLNLNNPNPVAVEIAKGTLSAICRATGIMAPQDSAELHNIPIEVKVTCRKDATSGEIRNDIKGYAKAGGGNGGGFGAGAAFSPPPAQTPHPAAAPAAVRKTAPWAKS